MQDRMGLLSGQCAIMVARCLHHRIKPPVPGNISNNSVTQANVAVFPQIVGRSLPIHSKMHVLHESG